MWHLVTSQFPCPLTPDPPCSMVRRSGLALVMRRKSYGFPLGSQTAYRETLRALSSQDSNVYPFYTLWGMAFWRLLDYSESQQSSLIGVIQGL
jgi:hypothetical protein